MKTTKIIFALLLVLSGALAANQFTISVGADKNPVSVGDTLSVTTTVTNQGTTDYSSVSLVFDSNGVPISGRTETTVTRQVSTFSSGQTEPDTFTLAPSTTGTYSLKMTARYSSGGSEQSEYNTYSLNVQAAPVLTFALAVSPTTVNSFNYTTVTATITNVGGGSASNVAVVLSNPSSKFTNESALTQTSAVSGTWAPSWRLMAGNESSNQTYTFNITVTSSNANNGSATSNSILVIKWDAPAATTTTSSGGGSSGPSDTAVPKLTITAEVSPMNVTPGGKVAAIVNVKNEGKASATNVRLTVDNKPFGWEAVPINKTVALGVNSTDIFIVDITAPNNATVGELYRIILRATCGEGKDSLGYVDMRVVSTKSSVAIPPAKVYNETEIKEQKETVEQDMSALEANMNTSLEEISQIIRKGYSGAVANELVEQAKAKMAAARLAMQSGDYLTAQRLANEAKALMSQAKEVVDVVKEGIQKEEEAKPEAGLDWFLVGVVVLAAVVIFLLLYPHYVRMKTSKMPSLAQHGMGSQQSRQSKGI